MTITVPVEIGGKKYKLSWHVVEAPIPLLWGKDSMKRAEVILDLLNDRARIKGTWVDLIVSTCDFYGVYMLPDTEPGRGVAVDMKKKMTNKEVRKDDRVSVSMLVEVEVIKTEMQDMKAKCKKLKEHSKHDELSVSFTSNSETDSRIEALV